MLEPLFEPINPSIGGNVADFLGTLRSLETEKPYTGSFNPNGNPFDGQTIPQMVDTLYSMHPHKEDLAIASQRLDDIYGVIPGRELPQNLSEHYSTAKKSIETRIHEITTRENR